MACADPKWAGNWGDLLPRVSLVVSYSQNKTWNKLLSFATKAWPHSLGLLCGTWTGSLAANYEEFNCSLSAMPLLFPLRSAPPHYHCKKVTKMRGQTVFIVRVARVLVPSDKTDTGVVRGWICMLAVDRFVGGAKVSRAPWLNMELPRSPSQRPPIGCSVTCYVFLSRLASLSFMHAMLEGAGK